MRRKSKFVAHWSTEPDKGKSWSSSKIIRYVKRMFSPSTSTVFYLECCCTHKVISHRLFVESSTSFGAAECKRKGCPCKKFTEDNLVYVSNLKIQENVS